MNSIKDIFRNVDNIKKDSFFDAFKNYFRDRSDFDANLKKLNKEDQSKIIRLGFFYYVITNDIKHAGITLVSIFSIMEATAQNEFRTFDQWLLTKIRGTEHLSFPIVDRDCFKKIILSLQKEYFKIHGSSEKVRSFIDKYFCTKDKEKLTRAFQIKDKSIEFDSLNFAEQIKTIVDMLYNERNAFVHQGRLPQMSENSGDMILNYRRLKEQLSNHERYLSDGAIKPLMTD